MKKFFEYFCDAATLYGFWLIFDEILSGPTVRCMVDGLLLIVVGQLAGRLFEVAVRWAEEHDNTQTDGQI